MAELLVIEALSAGYGQAVILHDINFSIAQGQTLALLGRNGTGKTTLINTIAGATRLHAGRMSLGGVALHRLSSHQRAAAGVGWVPQERDIFHSLSVLENLTAVARPGAWTPQRVFKMFPRLAERQNNMGNQLSGGEQQMLAIGRALMANPDLLILDEPSEGLAPVIVDQLIDLLNQLADQGTSIMLVEQNISFVLDVVQRYCVLSKGRVVEQGSSVGLTVENLKKYISV
jgi:branched-chain amino acid transport system ATP-binding protein